MIAWLLDTLLYTGLLIALVLLLRRPVARWFGAQIAYALWGLPFLRLLLPPIVLPASLAPKAAPVALSVAASSPSAGHEAVLVLVTRAPAAAPAISWPLVALVVWLGGALAFLAWRVVSYRAMRRELLNDIRTVGEVGRVRLVESPAVSSPVAFGVRDKVVALPLLFMAQPDVIARDLAIAHELEHHRGRDLPANFAAQALLALHWFNPVAWLGWRAMRCDQEAACDARVLAGRERGERVRYAELIAGIAAGRRANSITGALAAPMACPVLGDASIVHRLRTLSRAEISPRRRGVGRLLLAGAALALPLTASFSYASAQDTPPEPPAPQADGALPGPSISPQPQAGEPRVQRFELHRDGGRAPERREVRRFVLNGDGASPERPMPHFEFHAWGMPNDPEYQRKMKAWSKEMQKWGERYGKQMEKWGREQGEQVRRFALVRPFPLPLPQALPQPPQPPQAPAAPHAFAAPAIPAVPAAPEVIEGCDGQNGVSTGVSPGGRQRIVICNRMIRGEALPGLRGARDRIARDNRLSEDVRRDVLQDLDRAIDDAQPERDGDDG